MKDASNESNKNLNGFYYYNLPKPIIISSQHKTLEYPYLFTELTIWKETIDSSEITDALTIKMW